MSKLIVVIAILGLSHPADAQPEPSIALKFGPNAATLQRENRTHRYGLSGGLTGVLQWPLGSQLSLGTQMDLLYVPRGANIGGEGGSFRQHYIDAAIAIRPEMRLGFAGAYLLMGGSWNVLLSANLVDAFGRKEDITDSLTRHDVTLFVGAGIALHLPSNKLGPFRLDKVFLEARHDRGLIDVFMEGDIKNRSTSLMVGLSFALGSHGTPSGSSSTTAGGPVKSSREP